MKRLTIITTCICTIFSLLGGNINVHAAENEEDDIMQYVIGGSGTEEDPYILSHDNEYKEMFDAMAREAVQPSIQPAIDFSGTLTGASHANQWDGGKWERNSAIPNPNNVTMRIDNITYNSYSKTVSLWREIRNNSSLRNELVIALGNGYVGEGLGSYLVRIFPALNGSSFITAITTIFTFRAIGGYEPNQEIIADALANLRGTLQINYATTYQGAWYASNCADFWHTYRSRQIENGVIEPYMAVAVEPGSYYGTGEYESF